MLVVVEDRDLHAFAQLALDVEAVGGLDVFKVDAAERGFQRGNDLDQFVRILLVDLDVEHVDARELLEEDALALHDGLAGQRADIAQTEHGGAVGDHADQIAACGVFEGRVRVFDDFFAGCSDAWRIGQCQIVLIAHLLGGSDGNLARLRELVVFECRTAQLGAFVSGGRDRILGHQASPAKAMPTAQR